MLRPSGIAPRWVAATLILALPGMCIGAGAGDPAVLQGSILLSGAAGPIAGARLHVANLDTGEIYSSSPAAADGSFRVEGLPAANYELAVESGDGFYLIDSPLRLAPGQSRSVMVEVNGQIAPSPAALRGASKVGRWSKISKVLLVAGSAVVVGVVLNDDDTEPPPSTSPFSS